VGAPQPTHATQPTRTCHGCELELPRGDKVYEGDFNASPECWAVFGQVLAAEFQHPVLFGQVHELTVDTYAVQHAGGRHRDKSVGVHLVGLYLVLERGIAPTDAPRYMQRMARVVTSWPHFQPPLEVGPLTVLDVARAGSDLEHAERVRQWAAQLWRAWSPHHAAAAELAKACFEVG
jgi:hypothetical protein